jgi:hypothetical protein
MNELNVFVYIYRSNNEPSVLMRPKLLEIYSTSPITVEHREDKFK